MSKFLLLKKIRDAMSPNEVLDLVKNVTDSKKLVGTPEREIYLDALNKVQGPIEQRASLPLK